MADVNDVVKRGVLTGDLRAVRGDSIDPGMVPDEDKLNGTAKATPVGVDGAGKITPIREVWFPTAKLNYWLEDVEIEIINGVFYPPTGGLSELPDDPGVGMVASDQPDGNPVSFAWHVNVDIPGFDFRDRLIDIPIDGTIDFSAGALTNPLPGTITVVSEETRVAAEAAAETAVLAADVAQQAAEEAVAPTDTQVASLIPPTSGSATASALKATMAFRNVRNYVTAGVDQTAPLQAAINSAYTEGVPLVFPAGTVVKTSSTITIPRDAPVVMEAGSYIEYTGTGVAVDVVDLYLSSGKRLPGELRLRVRRNTRDWTSGTGVRLKNVNWSSIRIDEIEGFETGLLLWGDNQGTCYNVITLGTIVNNKRNVRFGAVNNGWANQNTFLGGVIRHDSALGDYTGTYGIDMSTMGNGNVFLGVTMEGGLTEKTVEVLLTFNEFYGCRWEAVRAGGIIFLAGSFANIVQGGYGNLGPGSTIFNDVSKRNIIIGARGTVSYSDTASGSPTNGGLAAFEGRSIAGGADVLFRARNSADVGVWDVTAGGLSRHFVAGSSFPRWVIDPTSAGGVGAYGGIQAGRGVAAPDARLSRTDGTIPGWISNSPFLSKQAAQTLASNGLVTVPTGTADVHVITLQANATAFTLANPSTHTGFSQTITLEIVQDATGGRTWVPPTNVMWAGGTAPALSTAANVRDSFTLRYDSTATKWVEVSRTLAIA